MVEHTKATRDEQARGTSSVRALYLTLFNISFAALWLWIGASALLNTSRGRFVLFYVVEPRARWVQTFTLIEVVHVTETKMMCISIVTYMVWYVAKTM